MRAATFLRCLAMPLGLTGLLLIGTFSVLWGMAFSSRLFGIPLALILLHWMFRYAFELLDHTSRSVADPPVLSIEMLYPDEKRVLLLLLMVVLGFFFTRAADYWFGPVLKWVVGFFVFATVPAIFALQSLTGHLLQSFNPHNWLKLIRALDGAYVTVLAFLLGVYLFGWLLVYSGTAARLPLLIDMALVQYAWLACFALIGGALYERRDELELTYPADSELEHDEVKVTRRHDRDIDRIYAEWRGGAHQNAWQTLTAQVDGSADPIAELAEIYARSIHWPDARLANRIAREMVARHLAAGRTGAALDVARARIATEPDFRPYRAAETVRLAELARAAGDKATARRLLREFARFFPEDPLQPRADELVEQLDMTR